MARGRIAGVRWRIRPYAPAADREWAQRLWAAAMPSWWPVLPAGIAMIADGLVAEVGAGPVGLAAVDLAGSVPLILVHPVCQGRGIGTGLLAAAQNAAGPQRPAPPVTAWKCYGWRGRCGCLPAPAASPIGSPPGVSGRWIEEAMDPSRAWIGPP